MAPYVVRYLLCSSRKSSRCDPPPSGGLVKLAYSNVLFISYCLSALGTVPREGARDLFLRI